MTFNLCLDGTSSFMFFSEIKRDKSEMQISVLNFEPCENISAVGDPILSEASVLNDSVNKILASSSTSNTSNVGQHQKRKFPVARIPLDVCTFVCGYLSNQRVGSILKLQCKLFEKYNWCKILFTKHQFFSSLPYQIRIFG